MILRKWCKECFLAWFSFYYDTTVVLTKEVGEKASRIQAFTVAPEEEVG